MYIENENDKPSSTAAGFTHMTLHEITLIISAGRLNTRIYT